MRIGIIGAGNMGAALAAQLTQAAGDDPAAKSVVLELADQLGFDGLDARPLAESRRQQPGRRWRTRPQSRPPASAANTHSTES